MRSPNPSSFKNFSARRKRRLRPLFFLLLLIIGGGAAFFLFWENSAPKIPAPVEEKKIPAPAQKEEMPSEESYQEFDPIVEEERAAPDMEATHESLPREVDSEVGILFKQQEENGGAYFQDSAIWKKNAHKRVNVPSGVPQVAVVIQGADRLSPTDWKSIQKLPIPLTLVVSATHRVEKKTWMKGREIFVQGSLPKGQPLEKRFPQAVGMISTKGVPDHADSYLILSPVKGLIGGMPHHVFSFPKDRGKKIAVKNQKVILWVDYKPGRLPGLIDYINRLRRTTFVPVSQFYQDQLMSAKKGTPINPQKIKEARPNLV